MPSRPLSQNQGSQTMPQRFFERDLDERPSRQVALQWPSKKGQMERTERTVATKVERRAPPTTEQVLQAESPVETNPIAKRVKDREHSALCQIPLLGRSESTSTFDSFVPSYAFQIFPPVPTTVFAIFTVALRVSTTIALLSTINS